MSRIKIVMAKHTGCDQKYIFAVRGHMTVQRGDALIVDTIRGRQLATAATSEIEINEDDIEAFGGYRPLKYVQERAGAEMRQMILADAINRIDSDLRNADDSGNLSF